MSDKIKKEIFNGVGENVKALAQLFPSAVKDGEVDFAALKQELGEFVEVGAEKYDFTWAGKAKAKAEAVTDIPRRTLKYVKGDGVNEDTTGNLYIEGDNLEALKLLRNSYYNKIKMIYIDPPYNTGNDFVYKDNFAMTEEEKQAMAEAGEEVDEYGERLVKNNSDNSKYHTNWLNMMYPRLKIARDLLTDDGVIFISIDDNEQANLKKLCDEVFGESNFIDILKWKRKKQPSFLSKHTAKVMEYIFVYGKNNNFLEKLSIETISDGTKKVVNLTNNISTRKFKKGVRVKIEESGLIQKGIYTIKSMQVEYLNDVYYEKGKTINEVDVKAKFSVSQELINRFIDEDLLFITINNGLRRDVSLEEKNNKKAITDLLLDWGDNQDSDKEQQDIFNSKYFDYTKPTKLIFNLIKSATKEDDIILDFFSGSATTAHAVMQLNAEDGGNRKYICVQVPELCDEKSEAFKAGYKNICEIGKERIRRAGKKIKADRNIKIGIDKSKLMQRTLLDDGTFEDKYDIKVTPCLDVDILDNLDIGFKVFKVADTNIRMFSNELNNVELLGQVEIKDIDPEQIDFNNGATDLDVCYELLLRHRGIPLSSKVDKLSIGERTYIIADSIVVCLDKQVAESLVEQLAAIDPLPNKYIFRDSSFGDDISLKENTMIHLQAIIEKNSGASKKTYTVEFI